MWAMKTHPIYSGLTLGLAALSANTDTNSNELGLAACSFEISATTSQQIFPAGQFMSSDGQSNAVESGHWLIDEAIAKRVIADRAGKANDLLFDYEHQTLNAEKNGQPAPAAGWAKNANLEWIPGKGLFVKDVEWTATAKKLIQGKEYKYISPVFSYDKKTGAVVGLKHIAITNDPAIDGMQSLVALKHNNPTVENYMHPLLVQLLESIGITVDPAKTLDHAALTALLDSNEAKTGVAALKAKLAELATQTTEIAALKVKATANAVDLSTHVPVGTYNAVLTEMAALKSNNESLTVDQVIEQAQKDGKFIAAAEMDYLKNLGNTNVAALKSTLDSRPTVGAFTGKQTVADNPAEKDKTGVAQLTADNKLVADQLGISHADFSKQLAIDNA